MEYGLELFSLIMLLILDVDIFFSLNFALILSFGLWVNSVFNSGANKRFEPALI